jgi:6-phosphogluconate dehydrogenase
VPITLEGGKRIGRVRKEIAVTFKHPHPCLCEEGQHSENRVVFTLEPEESIRIEFFTKKPGFDRELERRDFNFLLYEKAEKQQYVEEYSKLLLDAILGDQTLFVSTDEVRAMWEFTDPIVSAWQAGAVPLATYAPNTDEALVAAAHICRQRLIFPGRERNEIGIVGLGKMGGGIARNLAEQGWRVVVFNRTTSKADALAAEQPAVEATHSLEELVAALTPPRIVWLMLPAGRVVDDHVFRAGGLTSLLAPGDIVIDGGNSYFKDSEERGRRLDERGFAFTDVGVSGGPSGARWGACLMVGGAREAFERLEPLWHDAARGGAYRFFPGHGAGHFVKMVHNGIEYGMMQSLAEGFGVLHRSPYRPDLMRVAEIYNRGSVIESRLVGWLFEGLGRHGEDLDDVSGTVGRTGEGEWTVQTARELGVSVPAISASVRYRIDSEVYPDYTGRLLSVLRESFGSHKATAD